MEIQISLSPAEIQRGALAMITNAVHLSFPHVYEDWENVGSWMAEVLHNPQVDFHPEFSVVKSVVNRPNGSRTTMKQLPWYLVIFIYS